MGKRKQASGLYAFLDREGVLASGDERLIQEAKQKYWAQYKKEWRKQKRKQNKSVTVYLDVKEYGGIRKAAAVHAMSPTKFIKQAALATAGKQSPFSQVLVGQIRELFGLCITDVEVLVENRRIPINIGEGIIDRMEQLEDQVLNLITHPK